MASIEFKSLHKRFGAQAVLHDINLRLEEGEFVVLVGPSGCGKTTLLRVLAGLEPANEGQVLIDGQDMTDALPGDRGLAMVFQSYALYPHMTVRQNLSFGMRMRGTPKAVIEENLQTAVSILQLHEFLDRKPGELSGGQCQRVAIGRAIVQQPGAFLFDEPLSNLDAELRLHLRLELVRLHRELKATMVCVTHDQVEAMTMADRIVVMRGGVVEQVGTPQALYDAPCNRFVAQFLGSPPMNIFPLSEVALPTPGAPHTGAIHWGIRPEHLQLCARSEHDAMPMQVLQIERHGGSHWLHGTVGLGGPRICVQTTPDHQARTGEALLVKPLAERIHFFDAQGLSLNSGDHATAGSPP